VSNIGLIVAALTAGASAGLTNTATAAVEDAYTGLKALLRPWVRGEARAVLDTDETDEGVWQARLAEELEASGAAEDAQVRAAAQLLLGLADPAKAATYNAPVTINHGGPVPPAPPATV
jgi:hypothetical protein